MLMMLKTLDFMDSDKAALVAFEASRVLFYLMDGNRMEA